MVMTFLAAAMAEDLRPNQPDSGGGGALAGGGQAFMRACGGGAVQGEDWSVLPPVSKRSTCAADGSVCSGGSDSPPISARSQTIMPLRPVLKGRGLLGMLPAEAAAADAHARM